MLSPTEDFFASRLAEAGIQFHRQRAVAGYRVDFFLLSSRTAIELDGQQKDLITMQRDLEIVETGIVSDVIRIPNSAAMIVDCCCEEHLVHDCRRVSFRGYRPKYTGDPISFRLSDSMRAQIEKASAELGVGKSEFIKRAIAEKARRMGL